MNAIELNQIMAAAVGCVRYSFPGGPMIPLQSIFDILNTHCREAAIITVKNEDQPNGYRVAPYQTGKQG